MTAFRKATKESAKLRLALFGPSGSGKTYSALRIATGMGGKIAVIDTERRTAIKYSDRFEFDVIDDIFAPEINEYVDIISLAVDYDILILDSITHVWRELVTEVDKIARAKFGGNTWAAWSEGNPKQHKLVNAILEFPGHVIATIRSKTEWSITQDDRGKNKPTRIGLAPEQGKGIEYEFDLLMELTTDHLANVIKDRTGKYQDKMIEKPGEEFGKELNDWLSTGESREKVEQEERDKKLKQIDKLKKNKQINEAERARIEDGVKLASLKELDQTIKILEKWINERKEK